MHDLAKGTRLPLTISPSRAGLKLATLLREQPELIEMELLQHGALLFRGFNVRSAGEFEDVAAAVSPDRLAYEYRSTPRTSVADRIFTASEYPPDQHIPLHNENAYQRQWPLKIAFCCIKPATQGGETPLADMRCVSAALGEQCIAQFEARGVRYVRHYHPYVDVPWQTVFQTQEPSAVSRYCAEHGIEHEWLDRETLRTTQVCHGVARHPATGERLYFNQAHLFHVSSVGVQARQDLIDLFGADRLPRHAYFGDGGPIAEEELRPVRQAFDQAAICFPWQSGDVLLLDNMQVAHGRRPFRGQREHLAVLLELHSPLATA